ncbi:flagellar assembly protein FliX [Asticcacaulis sp. EMRT-3]|uniref:flagellar assembly protein FliX n=1 Tax=Asticcacaulis sp. EMRT-3 TaxID=3040349 RepID=UPI0024AFFE92|nr:flagellar assembly protein FliX [Asticcacaulis sp. EMRT-3]MDI7774799.1 flagellar assembly protein FliX [Asticcacaulis sp. EMRT-3]
MTIRINSATGAASSAGASGVRKTSGGFSLSGSSGAGKASAPSQSSAAVGMLGIDALVAIQAEEDVLHGRRRRQIKRSHDILDALDDIKVSVLSGDLDDEALLRLQGLIALHREDISDDRLQGVLNEIETRACVELAKRRLV